MLNKVNNIFEHTGCLPEEILIKYLSGELTPAEKHEAEKHLVDCEMCSDALEGLGMIEGVQRIQHITSELNRKIQDRVNTKKPGIFFLRQYRVRLAMAAAVLLIAGMILVFRNIINKSEETGTSGKQLITEKIVPHPKEDRENENKDDRVQNAGERPEAKPLERADGFTGKSERQKNGLKTGDDIASASMPAPDETLVRKEEKTELEKEPVEEVMQYVKTDPEETEEVDLKENLVAYENSLTLKSKSRSGKAAGGDVDAAPSATRKASQVAGAESAQPSISRTGEMAAPESKSVEIMTDAAKDKYSGDVSAGTAGEVENALEQNPENEKALFFSAVSYYDLDKTDSAITYFNKILKNKSGQYYDDAQWYISMAYIKKNDIQKARGYLLELKNNSQSQYQKKAEEALDELAE